MAGPIEDRVRIAMTGGGDLELVIDVNLNQRPPGSQLVYLTETEDSVFVNRDGPGEEATILWLPWKQGELTALQPYSIAKMPENSLFLTYYLSGCKVFGIQGGPVWHIDAPVDVGEFWPQIVASEWVEDNWQPGTAQAVAYLHRAGQTPNLWDLSAYLTGAPPTTYGAGNVGAATVGGVVNAAQEIDFYFQASPWAPLPATQQLLSKY